MDTSKLEKFGPRLSSLAADIASIRSDLRAAIVELRAQSEEEPPAPKPSEPPPPVTEDLPPPPPVPHVELWSSRAPREPREPHKSGRDWEALVAGRWLHLVGLLLVFLGTGFFLKVAFDHNWIVPTVRVWLGIICGAALIAYAQRFVPKDRTYFAEGITALGGAIEFLSLYFAGAVFHLTSPAFVLAGMVLVNAAIAAIAWRRHSERLGILAAAGGFLAPMLAGANGDPWMLAAYLVTLNAGMLVLAELVESQFIAPIAAAGTLLYAFENVTFVPMDGLYRASIYAALYAPFAINGWIRARIRKQFDLTHSVVTAASLAVLVLGLETTLWPAHRLVLAEALFALTGLHLAVAIAVKSRHYAWLSVLTTTLAIPAAFNTPMADIAWAAEAAILAIAGARLRDRVFLGASIGLLAADVLVDMVLYANYSAPRSLLNDRFESCAAAVIAISIAAFCANRSAVVDEIVVRALRVGAHLVALLGIATEAWSSVQIYGGTQQAASAALSIVGAAFAAVLIAVGLYKRDAMLRWEGLGLIVITAAKVLLFDLSFLDLAYRVISAVLVGIVLIAVSYIYQRRAATSEE